MSALQTWQHSRLISWSARALLCSGALVYRPALCEAQPSATELAVARRLFEDAVRLEHESRWELAASKLRDALAVKDTPGLRFHLAHCEEQLGRLVEALISYDQARELIAAGAKAPDVEALLEPARDALEKRVPYLLLVPPAEVERLDVELDGKAVARSVLGRPAPVNPATHRIVARAPGYKDYTEEVQIAEGERRTLQLNMIPVVADIAVPGAAAASSAPSRPGKPESNTATPARTYVLAGEAAFTVATLGVGIGFWMAQNTAADRVDRLQTVLDGMSASACDSSPPPENCSELTSAIDDYDRARRFSTWGFAGAGVGAAATILTFVLWPSSPVAPHVRSAAGGTWLGVDGQF
jgi:tetratricopeptide (TPR) repeat protein